MPTENPQELAGTDIWFFRQAGGCLEIGQLGDSKEDPDRQDLVHIECEDIPRFMVALTQFEKDTNGMGQLRTQNTNSTT
jgi:hypothetical protein